MGRRTLVVDDHPLTRAALIGLLEQHEFPVVGEAGDGEEAIGVARVSSSRTSSCSTCRCPGSAVSTPCHGCGRRRPDCEVIVLTASGTEDNLLAAIGAGRPATC